MLLDARTRARGPTTTTTTTAMKKISKKKIKKTDEVKSFAG